MQGPRPLALKKWFYYCFDLLNPFVLKIEKKFCLQVDNHFLQWTLQSWLKTNLIRQEGLHNFSLSFSCPCVLVLSLGDFQMKLNRCYSTKCDSTFEGSLFPLDILQHLFETEFSLLLFHLKLETQIRRHMYKGNTLIHHARHWHFNLHWNMLLSDKQ